MMKASASSSGLLVADGHVHVHRCFPVASFLDLAASHLTEAGARASRADQEPRLNYLLLAETQQDSFYDRAARGVVDTGAWRIRPTAEPEASLAVDDRGRSLVLVAGRQIPTRERLEVLAIGTLERVDPGRPLRETLDRTLEAAALTIIPWGFGKWWGRRGQLVDDAISRSEGRLYTGDNGGRLRWTPRPRLMRAGEAAGVRVLPGSDPLPFPEQVTRVGRSGFVVEGSIDPERPLSALVRALTARMPLRPFHRGETPSAFVRSQVRMQLVSRGRR